MNWLAHVFLSKPQLDFQLGNLLADRIDTRVLSQYSEGFAAGVRCHREIDRFTDTHPIVRQSKARIFPKYKHFAAVLVDVYYDHNLVRHWDKFSDVPYRTFVQNFYDAIPPKNLNLGQESIHMLQNIVKYDVIGHYDTIEGVALALKRLSNRMKRPDLIDITDGADSLATHLESYDRDFLMFFPELQEHIEKEGFLY